MKMMRERQWWFWSACRAWRWARKGSLWRREESQRRWHFTSATRETVVALMATDTERRCLSLYWFHLSTNWNKRAEMSMSSRTTLAHTAVTLIRISSRCRMSDVTKLLFLRQQCRHWLPWGATALCADAATETAASWECLVGVFWCGGVTGKSFELRQN